MPRRSGSRGEWHHCPGPHRRQLRRCHQPLKAGHPHRIKVRRARVCLGQFGRDKTGMRVQRCGLPHDRCSHPPQTVPRSCTVVVSVGDSGVPSQTMNFTTFLTREFLKCLRPGPYPRSTPRHVLRMPVRGDPRDASVQGLQSPAHDFCQQKGAPQAPTLRSPTVMPPGPIVSITGGPFKVMAGLPAQLTGSATCSYPPCAYGWVVACPPSSGFASQTTMAAGLNATITTGPKNGTVTYQLNTVGLATAASCNVSFTATGALTPAREVGWRHGWDRRRAPPVSGPWRRVAFLNPDRPSSYQIVSVLSQCNLCPQLGPHTDTNALTGTAFTSLTVTWAGMVVSRGTGGSCSDDCVVPLLRDSRPLGPHCRSPFSLHLLHTCRSPPRRPCAAAPTSPSSPAAPRRLVLRRRATSVSRGKAPYALPKGCESTAIRVAPAFSAFGG